MTRAALHIIRDFSSPNSGAPAAVDGAVCVRHLVLHYTGMKTGAEALARLCDPAAEVSAHYLIEEDGRVFGLVDETRRAWHAGVAFWRGTRDLNSTSIGIELVNPGHDFGYRAFPQAQIDALIVLSRDIVTRHGVAARNVVGHSDIAPGRKQDPGELFPWRELADAGLGIWPTAAKAAPDAPWPLLSAIGYAAPGGAGSDLLDPTSGERDVIAAFQQRFRPANADGVLDSETMGLISGLAAHLSHA